MLDYTRLEYGVYRKNKTEMKLGLPLEHVQGNPERIRLFSLLTSDECISMTFPLLLKAFIYKMELVCGVVQLLSKIKAVLHFI
jgi:hypothetical protein